MPFCIRSRMDRPMYPPPDLGIRGACRLFASAGWFIAGAILLLNLSGCVTNSEHEGVLRHRDELQDLNRKQETQIGRLKASEASLANEIGRNLEDYEDLRIEFQELRAVSGDLEVANAELGHQLDKRVKALESSRRQLQAARVEVNRLAETYTGLMSDLEAEVATGQIEIEQLREGILLSVSDDILFASGSARLDPIGRNVLEKLSEQLRKNDHFIEVQGHTDSRAISGTLAKRYASNWELAAARAALVVRLIEEGGVSGERLRVVSFASFRPIVPNDTAENRAQNRRIEIRLRPSRAPVIEDSGSPAERDSAGH